MLFRESWSVGGGKVTVEGFFTVLCERGHMIRCLNIPLCNDFPEYDVVRNKLIIYDSNNAH